MEHFPIEFKEDPRPVAFFIGSVESEPNVHKRLGSCLQQAIATEYPAHQIPELFFKSVSYDFKFREKSPPKDKDHQHAMNGILKSDWIVNHKETLPSVVIMTIAFSVDWSTAEWIKRETTVQDRYQRLRYSLSTRDVKIILVVIRTGSGGLDKEVADERLTSMKRHLQIDNRNVLYMSANDFSAMSAPCRRLCKLVRDCSVAYYVMQGKRLKSKAKSVSKLSDSVLIARFCFKAAFYYEFQGQLASYSLRYYRQCFQALMDLSISKVELLEQVKMLAEWVNYKIIRILLMSSLVNDSCHQFRIHINRFRNTTGTLPWRHHAWMANQYVIYCQLLEGFNVPTSFIDPDRSNFLLTAFKYAKRRRQSYVTAVAQEGVSVDDVMDWLAKRFDGCKFLPADYIGGPPVLADLDLYWKCVTMHGIPATNKDNVVRHYYESQESKVNHYELIFALIERSLSYIPPTHLRCHTGASVQLADLHLEVSDPAHALSIYSDAIEVYITEKWFSLAIPILLKAMTCAVYLGRLPDFVCQSLRYYALCKSFSDHKHHTHLEQLHLCLEAIFKSSVSDSDLTSLMSRQMHTRKPRISDVRICFEDDPTDAHVNSSNVVYRSEYASALCSSSSSVPAAAMPYRLSSGQTFEMNDYLSLFEIKVNFSKMNVEVGQCVRVEISITSSFGVDMHFQEMFVHYTHGIVVQHFVDESGAVNDRASGNDMDGLVMAKAHYVPNAAGVTHPIPATLLFHPRVTVTFTSFVYIPEDSLAAVGQDTFVCVDRVKLVAHVPKSCVDLAKDLPAAVDTQLTSGDVSVGKVALSLVTEDANVGAVGLDTIVEEKEELPMVVQEEDMQEPSHTILESVDDSITDGKALTVCDSFNETDGQPCIEGDDAGGSFPLDNSDDEDLGTSETPEDVVRSIPSFAAAGTFDSDDDDEDEEMLANEMPRASMTEFAPLAAAPIKPVGYNRKRPSVGDAVFQGSSIAAYHSSTFLHRHKWSSAVQERISPKSEGDLVDRIAFDVSPFTRNFAREKYRGKTTSVKDLSRFVGSDDSPNFFKICQPAASITMLDIALSNPLVLLQGTVQRFNIYFDSHNNEIHNGKCFLSSDYVPNTSPSSSVFWYPDMSSVTDSCKTSVDAIDKVIFYPIALTQTTLQPEAPMCIPSQSQNTIFCIPLFLRCEKVGSIAIKMKIEYVPNFSLQGSVTKEFEVNVTVVKAITMNFNMLSMRESATGISSSSLLPTVIPTASNPSMAPSSAVVMCRGDVVQLTSSITCLSAIQGQLDILAMSLKLAPSSSKTAEDSSPISPFTILSSVISSTTKPKDYLNLLDEAFGEVGLRGSNASSSKVNVLQLKQSEMFISVADILCKEVADLSKVKMANAEEELALLMDDKKIWKKTEALSNVRSPVVLASVGSVSVQWRVSESTLLTAPPRLPMQADGTVVHSSSRQEVERPGFAWMLPPRAVDVTDATCNLVTNCPVSRVCEMTFSVPSVQLLWIPFDVTIDCPTTMEVGKVFHINVHIKNKTWKLERMVVKLDLHDCFLVTGYTSVTVEVGPQREFVSSFGLIPLECGHLPLPHIVVNCERSGGVMSQLVDVGNQLHQAAKSIFIKPSLQSPQ